jgi:hypoxanthine phosphoribosyltransferase
VSLSPEKALQLLRTADQLYSANAVADAVARLAREISARLADSFPLVLSVMRGSVIFAGQLLPQLRFPLEFDYLDVTRYGAATQGGEISWKVTPGIAVTGRTVLVLDDILDEGKTLAAVRETLLAAGAKEVFSAVVADKDIGRAKPVSADFIGLRVPDRYVFGFGMDAYGAWRNLPEIYALRQDPGARIQDPEK